MVSLAVGLVIFSSRNLIDQTDQTDQTDRTDQTGIAPHRNPRASSAFWDSARAPDPGHDLPIIAIRPEDLGIVQPSAPIDHPDRIASIISQNDHPAIQSAALSWFEQDPTAARDWLAMQTTYDDLQPAISYIVSKISENGDLKTALEWSALLKGGTLRDDTIFEIHALALRNGKITVLEINPDLIPPARIEELLGGAAGD